MGSRLKAPPVGRPYAVWTCVRTAVRGILLFGEAAARLARIGTIVGRTIGLKLVSAH